MTKTACITSLHTSLTQTASWRAKLSDTGDRRYARAAKRLEKLAGEAASLTDSQWAALEPHFKSDRWHDAVRQTSRLLGFAIKKMSLSYFVHKLVGLLEAPATS
jgi:hypothetical protein